MIKTHLKKTALTIVTLFVGAPALGSTTGAIFGGMVGGFMGGAIAGTACGPCHCHTVVYKHKSYSSRYSLEKELEELEYAHQKLRNYCKHIEQESAFKDQEIMRLRKQVKHFESSNNYTHHPCFSITTQTIL